MYLEANTDLRVKKHCADLLRDLRVRSLNELRVHELTWSDLCAAESRTLKLSTSFIDRLGNAGEGEARELEEVGNALIAVLDEIRFEKDIRSGLGSREPRARGGDPRNPVRDGRASGVDLGPDGDGSILNQARQFRTFLETGEGLRRQAGEQRAILATGTGAQGGFALPEILSRTIQDQLINVSPIRAIAQVQQITSNDYKQLVGLRGAAANWLGEGDTRTATDEPTMAEVAPTMGELSAYPQISQWALDDLVINPGTWLQMNVTDVFAQLEGAAFVSGNGTKKPTGFLAGPTPVTTADASRAFGTLQYLPSGAAGDFLSAAFDVFGSMIYTLKAGYRTNARWVMNSKTAGRLRIMKDADGRFMWQDSLAAGQPALLMGYPVTIAEDMPDIGANTFPVAFGDFFRGYLVADRTDIRIVRDEVTLPGFVRYIISKRVGGNILDSNAIKLLKMSVS